jgi:transposase
VISAIMISPKRQRLGLYFRLLPENTGAKAEDTVSFLKQVSRSLRGPLTICWDRSRIHDTSLAVRDWLAKHTEVETVKFPGYAPELNPDEYVWSHAKYAELCNYAAPGLPELSGKVKETLQKLRRRRDLLQNFIDHAHLNWNSG